MFVSSIRKKGQNIEVSFEGHASLICTPSVFAGLYLYKGKELSNEDMEVLERKVLEGTLLSMCLNKLSGRVLSKKQIRDYLRKKKADNEVISTIITKLESMGLLNDYDYSCKLVETLKKKNKSSESIISTLKLKGISKDDIAKVLNEFKIDDYSQALKVTKKYMNLLKSDEKKIYSRLLMKGFSYATIQKVLKKIKYEMENSA